MHPRYYSTSCRSFNRLQHLSHYREVEQGRNNVAVTSEGDLLEYETLELRIHPPNVNIDNNSYEDRTVLIIDSANRPGTLVEVSKSAEQQF